MSALRFLASVVGALWRERAFSPERVQQFQDMRLRRLLAHAVREVPFYRDHFLGLDMARVARDALPPVTKAQLMARFNDTVAGGVVTLEQVQALARNRKRADRLPNGWVMSTTSGTTGQVGYFVTEPHAWETLRGTTLARILRWRLLNPAEVLRFGPWRRYRMGFVTATGGHYVTYLLSLHAPYFSRLLMRQQAFNILTPMPQLCGELNVFQPHYLHGYPTFVEALAHEQLARRLHIAPEIVSLGSEPVTPMARAALKAAFSGASVIETYGTTECVALATQCAAGRLHVNDDVCLLENVDAAGSPVPEGVLGSKVLITNLLTYAQPVIRYEVGDQVVLEPPGCSCGSPFRCIRVLGRTDDTFYLKGEDGLFHAHSPLPFEVLFLEADGLKQYQLVHERQNELRVYFTRDTQVETPVVLASLQALFGEYLARNGLGRAVTVAYQETDEILRDPNTKKIRQIVSRVPAPENAHELSGPWRLRGSAPPPA
jgi:phenylacetate-coenzyme A ligase PaaK-like adenylate-forming protein